VSNPSERGTGGRASKAPRGMTDVVVVVTRRDQPKPPAVAIVRQNGLSSASCRASVAVTPVSRQIWWIQVVGGQPLARLHSCDGRGGGVCKGGCAPSRENFCTSHIKTVSFYAFPVIFIGTVTFKKGTLIKRAGVRTPWTAPGSASVYFTFILYKLQIVRHMAVKTNNICRPSKTYRAAVPNI